MTIPVYNLEARSQSVRASLQRRIRILLSIFIAALVFSGASAIPLETELNLLAGIAGAGDVTNRSGFVFWLSKVREALAETNARYPFIAYGTDWLAFAHFVLALAFIGV